MIEEIGQIWVWAVQSDDSPYSVMDSLWTTELRAQQHALSLEGSWVTVLWEVRK